MFDKIINFSIKNKLIILLFTALIIGSGVYSLTELPINAVPDITNNQVQVITTSRNLATQEVEKFLTYPVELEMANLPNVKEIRSVSKFGLSVVTIVFDEEIGTYLPRQLIAEKIKSAEEKIPQGFGTPFMGPVSTGLGEIYQYVLEVDSNSSKQYSTTELRTIQDWVVKRQLSGIPGVVEVNTWGGYLKQYEVAINPQQIRAMDISISEIYAALENNNSVAGGGYIEKGNESYFIRGEGMANSIEDIENTVVKTRDNQPILIKDIASVDIGSANRFGAITGNGEGEKVLGQVMMLKGADSKQVIEDVKERVEKIQSSLPEGIRINGFLERSELIEKTTFTISENLILGCLIVIFVVVLLLGNLRSGLVVASVIPLCLFFALTLMYIFGVNANLMSLGAIDFGIIIDGAVIIVEYVAYKITTEQQSYQHLSKSDKRSFLDKITLKGTSKMMRSAIFGQLIIILVFIPIFTLTGVEGKMFKPMALVFSFALIGAMIFCFTYVPVMASLFLKPTRKNRKTISTRLVNFLTRMYEPILRWALKRKAWVLSIAVLLLIITFTLFNKMGGEFVPTLDEGDLVIQPVLKTGTSLSKTIETTTQIEKVLMKFPEVEQVITRIGAAEVPTDPMSMEESDVIVKLKPKSEWKTTESKDELTDKFKEALTDIAGVDYEFTQPIEMRFNELITGVRADLAIKIYGEDLDVLHETATKIESAIQNVEGASDIIVEKVDGLPQMTVKYKRNKMAKYGLTIDEINNILNAGFAGKSAGTIFEGEKQFDLVVRFDQNHRKDITNIENTTVRLPNGQSLPLSEFASINYTKGPAKISRDNTKRRIVIGVNVRNRDLESVVTDVQQIIEKDVIIPKEYVIEYGGQFENLRSARNRLMIAVPIALLLIFIFLYFAFKSIKDALMIFSAIPLSAVGGILFLYMRDLPFSISAGVGFIALFGIAVLNGIVLIEQFKELKNEGITDVTERIVKGATLRLRPVLLTASAAALGFLPMAISSNAGAEVQRPLATVVIGGLITATILTLVVLPILYAIFDAKSWRKKNTLKKVSLLLIVLGSSLYSKAQTVEISLPEAQQISLRNNNSINASRLKVEQNNQLEKTAFSIEKTEIYYSLDQNNLAGNNLALNVIGLSQAIKLPTFYIAQKNMLSEKTKLANYQLKINEETLKKEVAKAYYTLSHWKKMSSMYQKLDSIFKQFEEAAKQRFEAGETNELEWLMAQTKSREITLIRKQSGLNHQNAIVQLNRWIQGDTIYTISTDTLGVSKLHPIDTANNSKLLFLQQSIVLSQNQKTVAQQSFMPELSFDVFHGGNQGPAPNQYFGFQIGMGIPIFYGANKGKLQAAKTEILIQQNQLENEKHTITSKYQILKNELSSYRNGIEYYNQQGKKLVKQTLYNADQSYRSGDINYLQYVSALELANSIEINYLQNLLLYNLTVIEANYLTK